MITYTADIFCDGEGCRQWAHGLTANRPPTPFATRRYAPVSSGWMLNDKGKDYCPACARKEMEKRREVFRDSGKSDTGLENLDSWTYPQA